jgi:hypothetical protein
MPHVAPALLVASGLVAALAGCEAVPASSQPPAPVAQNWICGREYVNHAWGYARNGTVIDRDGNVWRYSNRTAPNTADNRWSPKDPAHLTDDDLKARYQGSTNAGIHVSPQDIAQRVPLIAQAATGKLTAPRMTAADMGAFVTYCYLHDAGQHSYREVTLEQHGDLTMANTAPEAQALKTWIDQVLGKDF